jgi:hypothetical protein
MEAAAGTAGTSRKEPGKKCCCGKCGGFVGGTGSESGVRLPAKMAKRNEWLKKLFQGREIPAKLLLPPGKVEAGGMGDVRVSKAHFDSGELQLSVRKSTGELRTTVQGTRALPRRPLAEVRATVANQQQGAEPAAETTARPARGERAQQEAEQALVNACRAALEKLQEAAEEGRIDGDDVGAINARLEALTKANEANFKKSNQLAEQVEQYKEIVKGEGSTDAREVKQLKKKVKELEKELSGPTLSYKRFLSDKKLSVEIGDYLYLSTPEALTAWITFLEARHPLDRLVWLDSNVRVARAADEGDAVAVDEDGEGDEGGEGGDGGAPPDPDRDAGAADDAGDVPVPKRRRRRFPMEPADAVCMWLFILRTGLTFKRAGKLFGASKQTTRRAFVTMTALHREIFQSEFFVLKEDALRAIIPEMMRTFKSYEGVDTAVVHIIDGFERAFQKPSDDEAAAVAWSAYKHNYTAKFLLDILSNGAFYFISEAYGGSISDPDLSRVCGFLELMIEGLDVMADKGFLLQAELEELGCLCWIPPVMRRGQEAATAEESEETHNIANRRIYVENAVRRIKGAHTPYSHLTPRPHRIRPD